MIIKKKKTGRKAAVLALSLMMCLMLMPSYAFAEDTEAVPTVEEAETAVSDVTDDSADMVQETEEAAGETPEELTEEAPEAEPEVQEEPAQEVIEDELDLGEDLTDSAEYANSAQGVVVEATDSQIIIHLNGVGSSGSAKIYRYTAESYHHADPYKGLSANLDNGTAIADYDLGTAVDAVTDRYDADGTDHLYDKYYVLQGDKIVAGPFYASEIASIGNKNVTPFEVETKKGLTHEDSTTINTAVDMGVGNTVINLDLCNMIYANEDASGNPVDNSGRNAIKFTSNGETYYFNADYVSSKDKQISDYTKNGINVTLVIISWAWRAGNNYPAAFRYDTDNTDTQTLGFNTSNALGRKYWTAAMEFMAERYSDKSFAYVDQFVVGNEIDYTYDWYLIQPGTVNGLYQRADFNTFMEEYARTFRLADLAVKKYNSGAKILVSLTHNWAESSLTSYGFPSDRQTTARYNSYAPKEMFDWLVKQEGARGNFNWGLAVHPYPVGTTSSNPVKSDVDPSLAGVPNAHPVTGNADTTPWITVSNLELYQTYLERPENQYKGETRTVSLTEASICNEDKSGVSASEYQKSLMEQAASIAMMYYRAACIPCINEVAYFEYHDQNLGGSYQLGLAELDGTEKPAANVWKYVDTNLSFNYTNKYLSYIDPKAGSYKDLMNAVNSGYNWNKYWTDENLMPRKVDTPEPEKKEVVRIYGSTRYETGIKSADALKEQLGVEQFDSVILACGTNFADALAGSYLASVRNAPILLVRNRDIEIKLVQDYISKNLRSGGTIYMLGGEAVVPNAAVAGLKGFEVKRLGGSDRYDTNVKILREASKFAVEADEYLVASGNGFADSLSASAAGKPIILVKNVVQPSQKDYINSLKGKKFYVIGGTGAVNADMEKMFSGLGKTERIGGSTRYETSTNVARKFFNKPACAVIAYGANFPDGLCGGPLAYAMGGPLILAGNGKAEAAIAYADQAGIYYGAILGGPTLIDDTNAGKIFNLAAGTKIVVK